MTKGRMGRPRVLPPETDRIYVHIPARIGQEIRSIAQLEHRTVTAQIEILLERGLEAIRGLAAPAADSVEQIPAPTKELVA